MKRNNFWDYAFVANLHDISNTNSRERSTMRLTYLEYAKHLVNLFSTSLLYCMKCSWFFFPYNYNICTIEIRVLLHGKSTTNVGSLIL